MRKKTFLLHEKADLGSSCFDLGCPAGSSGKMSSLGYHGACTFLYILPVLPS